MYALVDNALVERLENDEAERRKWVFLEPSEEFRGYWRASSFSPTFRFDFDELIGPYSVVAPSGLAAFQEAIREHGYQLAFFEDPTGILDGFEHLNDPPPFEIVSPFADTINGMLRYQVQGLNMIKDLPAGVFRWDTGTGKTVVAAGLVKYHLMHGNFDVCFFVVKKSNKVNTVRKLARLAGVDSIHISGSKKNREAYYQQVADNLAEGRPTVVVVNYEKFRDDFVTWKKVEDYRGKKIDVFDDLSEWGHSFFPGRRVMCIWDEMPTKLKTRTTKLYIAVCRCLYTSNAPQVLWDSRRPSELRQYMLSATPVENDPEDWFNCLRVLYAEHIYGTVQDFRDEYVSSYNYFDNNRPETWHQLEKMRMKSAWMVHQVDKTDPDVAKVFPDVIEEPYYIDWDESMAKLYNSIQKIADEVKNDEEQEGLHVLSLINVFQMLCDAPSMLNDSAAVREIYDEAFKAYEDALKAWEKEQEDKGYYTWNTRPKEPDPGGSALALEIVKAAGKLDDSKHAKRETLRSLLLEVHPDEKFVIFSKWNKTLLPILESWFEEWGVTYVTYTGSDTQKQAAQDAFQNDPGVRVFLSSDAGSDSIDLEAGSVVVHYNLPWKWSTYIQRQNRIHRPTSTFAKVRFYTLMMANSVEDRIMEIIMRKQGYHDGLFRPGSGDVSASARMTKQDLLYILTGL